MKTQKVARPGFLVAVLAVLAILVLAACGGDSGGGASATPAPSPSETAGGDGGVAVTIQDFAFGPATLTVKAGTTVTWTNNDSAPHNVTSTDGPGVDAATTSTFSSGTMAQGDTFSFTFDEPGTYDYECSIHASMASMHATVVVE